MNNKNYIIPLIEDMIFIVGDTYNDFFVNKQPTRGEVFNKTYLKVNILEEFFDILQDYKWYE
jgi:hypothetical protein